MPITTEVTCKSDGFRGLLRIDQAKLPVQILPFDCQLNQRTRLYAEQGMLPRPHLPAVLKAGEKIKKAECLCLCSVNIGAAEGERALPRTAQPQCLASPCCAAFIRHQLLLQRLHCSLCLSPVCINHLVLAVHQEYLFIVELIRMKEELICCGKHAEDVSPLLRICILSKVLLPFSC